MLASQQRERWTPVRDSALKDIWELSNAGRIRNAKTGRIITKRHGRNGEMVILADSKGRDHAKCVRTMLRSHFGDSNVSQKQIILDNDKERRRTVRREDDRRQPRELANPISHHVSPETQEKLGAITGAKSEGDTDMTIQASELGLPVEHAAHGEPTRRKESKKEVKKEVKPVTEPQTSVQYRRVVLPETLQGKVRESYEVSEQAEVLNTATGNVLVPSVVEASEKVQVALQRPKGSPYRGAASVAIDELVCLAFHGPQPSPQHGPEHINGDWRDCRAENLRWTFGLARTKAPKKPGSGQGFVDLKGSRFAPGYRISPRGMLRTPTGKIAKVNLSHGLPTVSIASAETGHQSTVRLDALVLDNFGPTITHGRRTRIIHKDGDPMNCALDNLQWKVAADEDIVATTAKPGVYESILPVPETVAELPPSQRAWVEEQVAQAPSFSHPGMTVGEVEKLADGVEIVTTKVYRHGAVTVTDPNNPPVCHSSTEYLSLAKIMAAIEQGR